MNNINSEFLYKFASYPENHQLTNEIAAAASSLINKLESLVLDNIDISDYNRRYFGGHIETSELRRLNLTKYGYVLTWALAHHDKPKEEQVFLDHGGGHGMLSLLAKQYGVGTVLHNDIYPISCNDARTIGEAVGLVADHYITGDIDDILEYCQANDLMVDCIANYDVIEHIYDIDDFLRKLHLLSPGRMSLFLASAANVRNPRISRLLVAMHKEFERYDRKPKYGRKPTDATRALVELRREIIEGYAPSLSSEDINQLADLTRGLIEKDIKERLDDYLNTGTLPPEPKHPTNTCDPFTGNWFEHLMNPDELVVTLNSTGFETTVICGFYDQPKKDPIKRWIKLLLNIVIRIMGKHGLLLAPFYALSGRKY